MIRLVAIAALAAVLLVHSSSASAQSTTTDTAGERVNGDIKGTVGLGLIGMEVGVLMPPLLGLQDQWWAWALFPVIGGAGGAVAGIFAFENGTPDPNITIPILVAGVALAVPALIGSMAIKAKRDTQAIESASLDAGTGLVRLNRGGTFVRVPALALGSRTNTTEQLRFGANPQRATTLNVPLLSGRF